MSSPTPQPSTDPPPWRWAWCNSVRLLPRAERQRYRWEFVADLRCLDRSHQLSYATGVFCTAWALRQQLTKEPTMNDTTTTPAIPLLCRLNLHHNYHYAYTEDGRRFRGARGVGRMTHTWQPGSHRLTGTARACSWGCECVRTAVRAQAVNATPRPVLVMVS